MWVVDKIDNDIVLLENINTLEKREVNISLLPSSIHEGAILTYLNNKYYLDLDKEEKRRLEIRERFKRLRAND